MKKRKTKPQIKLVKNQNDRVNPESHFDPTIYQNSSNKNKEQDNKNIKIVHDVIEFFKEEVSKAFINLNFEAHNITEFYIANLLSTFARIDQLLVENAEGGLQEETMVSLLKKAFESPRDEKIKNLKRAGDISLYTAGFFSDSLNRKLIDIDYYISIGENAYGNLSTLVNEDYARIVFGELSKKFMGFVDVISEISDKYFLKTNKDILRTYEKWLITRSERLRKQLEESGILPVDSLKTGTYQ